MDSPHVRVWPHVVYLGPLGDIQVSHGLRSCHVDFPTVNGRAPCALLTRVRASEPIVSPLTSLNPCPASIHITTPASTGQGSMFVCAFDLSFRFQGLRFSAFHLFWHGVVSQYDTTTLLEETGDHRVNLTYIRSRRFIVCLLTSFHIYYRYTSATFGLQPYHGNPSTGNGRPVCAPLVHNGSMKSDCASFRLFWPLFPQVVATAPQNMDIFEIRLAMLTLISDFRP